MKLARVVLDTNVVVSAHLSSRGFERYVFDLALSRKLEPIVSAAILAEYEAVLRRPKFSISSAYISRSMRKLRSVARIVDPQRNLSVTRDPSDNRFFECAEASRADYLVTGNKRHFPSSWRQTLIVNARELIEWIATDLQR